MFDCSKVFGAVLVRLVIFSIVPVGYQSCFDLCRPNLFLFDRFCCVFGQFSLVFSWFGDVLCFQLFPIGFHLIW